MPELSRGHISKPKPNIDFPGHASGLLPLGSSIFGVWFWVLASAVDCVTKIKVNTNLFVFRLFSWDFFSVIFHRKPEARWTHQFSRSLTHSKHVIGFKGSYWRAVKNYLRREQLWYNNKFAGYRTCKYK